MTNLSISLMSLSTPFPSVATVLITGGGVFPTNPRSSMALSCFSVLSAREESALFRIKMSAISMIPALNTWISSPAPGIRMTRMISASFTTSTSSCPTPTVSTRIKSFPAASRTAIASPVALAKPPKCPRVAMLRMKISGSTLCCIIRILSPKIAPPLKGLEGSTAIIPIFFLFFRRIPAIWSTNVLLPEPGEPVMPTMIDSPVCAKIFFIIS